MVRWLSNAATNVSMPAAARTLQSRSGRTDNRVFDMQGRIIGNAAGDKIPAANGIYILNNGRAF